MSDAEKKSRRIKERIDASQTQLDQEKRQLAAVPKRPILGDVGTGDDLHSKATQHPWLLLAAGAGAGLLLGALLPRRAGSRTTSRALGLAAAGQSWPSRSARMRAKQQVMRPAKGFTAWMKEPRRCAVGRLK